MPLWTAALLFLLFAAASVFFFRRGFVRSGRTFLTAGISSASLAVAMLVYAAAALLFLSSIN